MPYQNMIKHKRSYYKIVYYSRILLLTKAPNEVWRVLIYNLSKVISFELPNGINIRNELAGVLAFPSTNISSLLNTQKAINNYV